MLKKKRLAISITVFFLVVFFIFLLNTNVGGFLYQAIALRSEVIVGSAKSHNLKNFPTTRLVSLINETKNTHQFPRGSWWAMDRLNWHTAAIFALGSKKDENAKNEIKRILENDPEEDKCDVIRSIGKHKNFEMKELLYQALGRHESWRIDQAVLYSLLDLDDPSALTIVKREKSKITREYSRFLADQAIKKWELKQAS